MERPSVAQGRLGVTVGTKCRMEEHTGRLQNVETPCPFTTAMAENIYSKGTQVWFPDKELSWISGEVTSVTRNPDDTVKLVFQDERGKVSLACSVSG